MGHILLKQKNGVGGWPRMLTFYSWHIPSNFYYWHFVMRLKELEMSWDRRDADAKTVWIDKCEVWNIYVDFLWISLTLLHVNVLAVQNSSKASFISVHWKKSVLICSSQSPGRQEVAARGQFIIFKLGVSNFFLSASQDIFSQIL